MIVLHRKYWNDVSDGLCSFCPILFPCKNIHLVHKIKKKIDFHNKISALSTNNPPANFSVVLNIYIFYPRPPSPLEWANPISANPIIHISYVCCIKLSQQKAKKHKHNNTVAQTI